jgi:hypothetical protein
MQGFQLGIMLNTFARGTVCNLSSLGGEYSEVIHSIFYFKFVLCLSV